MKKKLTMLFTFLILLFFILLLYSHFLGTKGLFIREYKVESEKLPSSFNGFKIVHFSDLHYGTTINKKEMENLVKEINNLKPDIVVFTGDLLDDRIPLDEKKQAELSSLLNQIDASINKYIICGNHDTNPEYEKILESIDFINLDNTNNLIYFNGITPIRIVGLSDYLNHNIDINEAFNYNQEDGFYTILLTHEPDIVDNLNNYSLDLILAGHSHNGQVRAPFIGTLYTPVGSKKYYDEVYELNGTKMYISGGLGTSGPSFRFLVKPSFNFYRLYTK